MLLFPSALDDFSVALSFGVVSDPSAFTGLMATVGIETDCVMGLFSPGGGLLPSVMFRQCVRDVAEDDDDLDETLRGCLLNMLESEKE